MAATDCASRMTIRAGQVLTEGYLLTENKALFEYPSETKVTRDFGTADANIEAAAMFAESSKTKDKRGENRDAETKGFLTNRAADRGCYHPDHRSHRHSE